MILCRKVRKHESEPRENIINNNKVRGATKSKRRESESNLVRVISPINHRFLEL